MYESNTAFDLDTSHHRLLKIFLLLLLFFKTYQDMRKQNRQQDIHVGPQVAYLVKVGWTG